MAAAAVAAAEAREILKPTKYHGKSFQSLIVFHEILKTAPRRSHAIHFRYGSKSGSYCLSVPLEYQNIWWGQANMLICPPQKSQQRSVPDLHGVTVAFLALKKWFF